MDKLKTKKNLILFMIYGFIYLNLEIVFRAFRAPLVGVLSGISVWSLASWTTLWMFPIGALSGLILGSFNSNKVIKKWPNFVRILLGAITIYAIELSTGGIVNILFGLNAWNYSTLPFNFLGQISLIYLPVWLIISPVTFWIDDMTRHIIFNEPKPKKLIHYFRFK
jgi:uncharacterized membrane protein